MPLPTSFSWPVKYLDRNLVSSDRNLRERDWYNLGTYWNSFRLHVHKNTQCNVESAHLVIKKPLGFLLHFLRTRNSCAGVLKALKLSSCVKGSVWASQAPGTTFSSGSKGWSWVLSYSALILLKNQLSWNCQPECQPRGLWQHLYFIYI